jgi:hypothetical protein
MPDTDAPVFRDMKLLERKLADARQKVRNLTVMVMNPRYAPEKREILHQCERSARAEVKLRLMAIEYQRGLEGLEGPASPGFRKLTPRAWKIARSSPPRQDRSRCSSCSISGGA